MGHIQQPDIKTRATLIFDQDGESLTLRQKLEENDWCTHVADQFKDFKRLFQQHRFEVVIIYFNEELVPDTSQFEALANLNILTKWIAVTPSELWLESHPSILFSHLFYDYHRQPLRYDHLLATIGHAYGMAKLQYQKLKHFKVHHNSSDIIGQSHVTENLKQRVSLISGQKLPVLISGESGTGKQFISRVIHTQSYNSNGPFAHIRCGSTPERLLRSELFGHEKESLFKECEKKIGAIAKCHQGTLLLNDIEELSLDLQAEVADFIEHQQFKPMGSNDFAESSCRIIASTSSDLENRVKKEQFHEGLYQALCLSCVTVPTLSERHKDIPQIAQYFLDQFCEQDEVKKFSQSALDAMQQYHWPGNVRELMNRTRRAIILSQGELISEAELELPKSDNQQQLTLKDARDKVEKDVVIRTIAQAGYNHSKAAKELGISRTSLYRLISKHQIPL